MSRKRRKNENERGGDAAAAGVEAAGDFQPPAGQGSGAGEAGGGFAQSTLPAAVAPDDITIEAPAVAPATYFDGGAAATSEDDSGDIDSGGDDAGDEGWEDSEPVEELVVHDADAEDRAEKLFAAREAAGEVAGADDEVAPGGTARSMAELMAVIEALVFVSEEPLTAKTLAEVLKEERGWVEVAAQELAKEFNERNGGLMMREVAGGWQIATRAEFHEQVRAFLKSRPSAKLSLAALETLAVIAYKQPVTVPEILEIRGVQSSSAIKTLLEKRLIVAKGRKEVVGRPMLYGTSKEFLMQFGLRDLSELPNIEDFEDLAGGGS
jgi:segregation and condensation protein B